MPEDAKLVSSDGAAEYYGQPSTAQLVNGERSRVDIRTSEVAVGGQILLVNDSFVIGQ